VAAGIAVAAGTGAAQSTDILGTITFEGGAVLPAGHVEIHLEDPAIRGTARSRVAEMRVDSDGKSKSIAFSLSLPATSTVSPTLRMVARLERADGWLIARGSKQFQVGSSLYVTLNAAIY
jgi:hypothetical protein